MEWWSVWSGGVMDHGTWLLIIEYWCFPGACLRRSPWLAVILTKAAWRRRGVWCFISPLRCLRPPSSVLRPLSSETGAWCFPGAWGLVLGALSSLPPPQIRNPQSAIRNSKFPLPPPQIRNPQSAIRSPSFPASLVLGVWCLVLYPPSPRPKSAIRNPKSAVPPRSPPPAPLPKSAIRNPQSAIPPPPAPRPKSAIRIPQSAIRSPSFLLSKFPCARRLVTP